MTTISLFRGDADRELFKGIQLRVDRFRNFRYLESFLTSLALIAAIYFVSFFLLGLVCEISKGTRFAEILNAAITPFEPRPWGSPLSISYIATLVLIFLSAVIRSAFAFGRAQQRDTRDIAFLRKVYNDNTLQDLHARVTARAKSLSELQVAAPGIDEVELELLRTAVKESHYLQELQAEKTETERVFGKVTEILGVQHLSEPVLA